MGLLDGGVEYVPAPVGSGDILIAEIMVASEGETR
jgi:hypothetical protein